MQLLCGLEIGMPLHSCGWAFSAVAIAAVVLPRALSVFRFGSGDSFNSAGIGAAAAAGLPSTQ